MLSEGSATESYVSGFGAVLRDEQQSLRMRFRALFALRNLPTDSAVQGIAEALATDSVLLKHELAYVLGQMQNRTALPVLAGILSDGGENEIVRHEAAEAIAALGGTEYLGLLKKYADVAVSRSVVVSETCELGADLLARGGPKESAFGSFDPALPAAIDNLEELRAVYLNEALPLAERYRAMFRLRDLGTAEAIAALGAGFSCQARSDLFEHEIAFIFGQLSHPDSVPFLAAALADETRHEMIRHECAEALGSIDSEAAKAVLLEYQDSPNRIVRESVEIGLDIMDYKFDDPSLEYFAGQIQVSEK